MECFDEITSPWHRQHTRVVTTCTLLLSAPLTTVTECRNFLTKGEKKEQVLEEGLIGKKMHETDHINVILFI